MIKQKKQNSCRSIIPLTLMTGWDLLLSQ